MKSNVWVVETKGYRMRIALKPPKTEKEIRELFGPFTNEEKLFPINDKRFKKGVEAKATPCL